MPKRKFTNKRDSKQDDTVALENIPSRRGGFVPIIVPTQSLRHTTAIRYGKISSEVFCRNPERRRELGLPAIYVES